MAGVVSALRGCFSFETHVSVDRIRVKSQNTWIEMAENRKWRLILSYLLNFLFSFLSKLRISRV